MKAKRKRRMSRRRRERTYIAVMVLLAIAVSIGLTRSVMRDDKEFEEYEQQSQEFNARMQRIDEKREASGQNAMLEQVRTWQQEQDTEPDKYAVFDTMSADWGGEEDGFVLYEIPEEYSRTGGYFPEKMQVYTYCVCKQYGVRYDLVIALIEKESGYRFDKVGDDGHSIGYMQIYEECHRDRMERLNVTDLTNPYQNVLVGIDYLSELIERYGTIQDALAAYNYGEQGAKQHLWKKGIYVYDYNQTIMNRMKEIEEALQIAQDTQNTIDAAEAVRQAQERLREAAEKAREIKESRREDDTAKAIAKCVEAMEAAIKQTKKCLTATEEANKIIISQSGLDAILAAVKDYYERIRELETDININVDGGTPKSTDLLLVKGGTPFTTDYDKYIAGTSHTI